VSATATIEELDAVLADGTYDHCCVKSIFRVMLGLQGCGRHAAAVITVTCSADGPDTWPVCGGHLRAIRRHPRRLHCGKCRKPAALADAEVGR
jgi:hypothetical protein